MMIWYMYDEYLKKMKEWYKESRKKLHRGQEYNRKREDTDTGPAGEELNV